jgi:hypothetical protein
MRHARLAALILGFTNAAWAQHDTSVDVTATLATAYVWRGLALTDGPVIQPGVTVGYAGASFNLWANGDLDDVNGTEGRINEIDYTLDYAFTAGRATYSLGLIRYTFPNTAFDETLELYAGAGFAVAGSPSIKLFRDVEAVDGLYGSVGVSHGVPLSADHSLDIGVTLAFASAEYATAYYAGAGAGLTDLCVSAGYSLPLPGDSRLTFAVTYASLLGDAADAVGADPYTVLAVAYAAGF